MCARERDIRLTFEWQEISREKFPFTCHGQTSQNKTLLIFNFAITPLSTTPSNAKKRLFKGIMELILFKIMLPLLHDKLVSSSIRRYSIHSLGKCIVCKPMTLKSPSPEACCREQPVHFNFSQNPSHYFEDGSGCQLHIERFLESITNVE